MILHIDDMIVTGDVESEDWGYDDTYFMIDQVTDLEGNEIVIETEKQRAELEQRCMKQLFDQQAEIESQRHE